MISKEKESILHWLETVCFMFGTNCVVDSFDPHQSDSSRRFCSVGVFLLCHDHRELLDSIVTIGWNTGVYYERLCVYEKAEQFMSAALQLLDHCSIHITV